MLTQLGDKASSRLLPTQWALVSVRVGLRGRQALPRPPTASSAAFLWCLVSPHLLPAPGCPPVARVWLLLSPLDAPHWAEGHGHVDRGLSGQRFHMDPQWDNFLAPG